MAETNINTAITAIRSSEAEGFVASTLFSQGWSINFRALDIQSLLTFIDEGERSKSFLFISEDCEGLTPLILNNLKNLVAKVIIFQGSTDNRQIFPESLPIPATALELISLMRGTLRSPLIRTALQSKSKRRAKVIGIASASGGLGCTTFALNLASECAALNKISLVIDAHAYAPSLAALLGQRGLHQSKEPRQISQYLYAHEVTQPEISEGAQSLESFLQDYDILVIDLGTIQDFASNISGRRWSSEVLIWVSTFADELFFLSASDSVGLERLKSLTRDLATNSIKPSISFMQVQRPLEKRIRTNSESFLKLVTPLKPQRIIYYPYDARSVHAAQSEETTLLESNDKSLLRKAIADIAGEVIS